MEYLALSTTSCVHLRITNEIKYFMYMTKKFVSCQPPDVFCSFHLPPIDEHPMS